MKGYNNGCGWMGYLPSVGEYQQFDTEEDYVEYFRKYEERSEKS